MDRADSSTTNGQAEAPAMLSVIASHIGGRFSVHSNHRTTMQSHFLQIATVLATGMIASIGVSGPVSGRVAHLVGMMLGLIMAFEAFNARKQDGRIADLTDIDATCAANMEEEYSFPEGMRPASMVKAMDEKAKSTWTVGKTFRLRCVLFGCIGGAGTIASLVLLVLNH